MKPLFLTCIAVSVLALTACSGSGSTPPTPHYTATPAPTSTPTTVPVSYKASLSWTGPLAQKGIPTASEGQRLAQSIGGTNILVTTADTTDTGGILGAPRQAIVQAVVSPEPSSTPTVSFSTTSEVSTLEPTPSPAPGASAQPPSVLLNPNVVGATESGKIVMATIGAPVDATPTQNIIVYPVVSWACAMAPSTGEYFGGLTWTGTGWSSATDVSTADLYIMQSHCAGGYNNSDTNFTLYYPGGGTWYPDTAAFDGLTAASWINNGTSISEVALFSTTGDSSNNATLVFKAHDGDILKWRFLAQDSIGGAAGLGGAYEAAGPSTPDGFN